MVSSQTQDKLQDMVEEEIDDDNDDDAAQLVSEFPIPPTYYKMALTLNPPPIPHEDIKRSTKKAHLERLKTLQREEEEERKRFGENFELYVDSTNSTGIINTSSSNAPLNMDESDTGPWITVFGPEGYVEDPSQIRIVDECANPKEVQLRLSQLNKETLQGFVTLVGELVNNPESHLKSRDILLNNIELMLKESNKFREHQAREILIESLEQQLKDRNSALNELKVLIQNTDEELERLKLLETKEKI